MFKKVIAGVDGNQGGRDAIALAAQLAANDSELTLAHVYRGEAAPNRGSSAAYEYVERERALGLLHTARDESGLEAGVVSGGASSVGRGLHELAEAEQCDLLVVGSSRRGPVGRVLVGDRTRDALNGSPCAVAVAPAGYSLRPVVLGEIGVGYNGSPESEHALAVARALAVEHSARLSAFESVALPLHLVGMNSAAIAQAIPGLVEEARERIDALGDVEPHAAFGAPAEELALYGASVDLLVVGSRGYGSLGRLVHGSTSQELARTARCPLLVLPRARQRSSAGGMLDRAGRADAIPDTGVSPAGTR